MLHVIHYSFRLVIDVTVFNIFSTRESITQKDAYHTNAILKIIPLSIVEI